VRNEGVEGSELLGRWAWSSSTRAAGRSAGA